MKQDHYAAGGRRRLLSRALALTALGAATLAAAGLAVLPSPAMAQDFPTRPVRMVVPFGPGTTTDIIARVVGEGLAKPLGQTIVVENRSGAGGSIGSDLVAKAPPDGYSLVMGTVGTHAINMSLYRSLPYDALKDFVPIAFVGYTPTLLVVAADSPFKSLQDIAAQAKKPGGVSFASAGNGTSGHLAGELLKAKLGGEIVHVPYKQGGLAMSDVMSGQVHFMFYHPAAVMPHIEGGRLRALGASGVQRSSAAPDVAPIAEQGYKDFDLVAWFMLYAPAGTPQPVVARLREAAQEALASSETKGKLSAQGVELRTMKPDELAEFGMAEVAKWSDLVKRSGAQVD
jgi:tripartite-type tricarboxylate transporter receptor subunit TctC